MSKASGIVIVGGGLAAARTAEQLRKSGYQGPVAIVSAEKHLPYDRPPLSKDVLHDTGKGLHDVLLRPAEFYDDNDIALVLGTAAQSLDTAARTVTLTDDRVLDYDELVIATGLEPKRIPSLDLAGVRVLRSFDEALALREHATSARRAVIVGAGFIGCEVAASLRTLGVEVALVEPQPTPLAAVLGERIGELVARVHRAEGVDVRTGVGVAAVRGDSEVSAVELTDGTLLDADLVVVGIGSRPATDWLVGSGVALDNGVLCDEVGRTSEPHVWALGDVASWRDARGHQIRVEHWSNVADQARVMVPSMLGQEPPEVVAVPYFWSDQYDVKIQCLGEPSPDDIVHVTEDDGRKFLAYYERDGVLVAVVGGGMPGKVMKARAKIAAGAPIAEVLS
ncbi:MAG: FAD-dependent oxidoreductase [Actinomycetota bacterium]|nr:FAD-dependent oxidoreductase [Actinomycetota bacterium]